MSCSVPATPSGSNARIARRTSSSTPTVDRDLHGPLAVRVRVAGRRWSIEERIQTSKGRVGLDAHQVRRWRSWYRTTVGVLSFRNAWRADTHPAGLEDAGIRGCPRLVHRNKAGHQL